MTDPNATPATRRPSCVGTVVASVLLSALVSAAVAYGVTRVGPAGDAAAGDPALEQSVLKVIDAHPEAIIGSLENMQRRQMAEQEDKAQEQLATQTEALTKDADSPVVNPGGTITVVEFFDYHCGYCKRLQPTLDGLLKDNSDVRLVLKEFPILSPDSELASKASLGFYKVKPDAYWQYHSALMNHEGEYTETFLLDTASKLGADRDAVQEAMQSDAVRDEIAQNRQLAETIGVRGTPALVIGNELVPGAVERATIDNLIAKTQGGVAPENAEDGDADDAPAAESDASGGETNL